MSIQITYESADHFYDLHDDLGEALRGITYIFVESDTMNLPTDPIGLISWSDHEVDCVLTATTWRFPASMPNGELLEIVTFLIQGLVTSSSPPSA